VTARRSIWPETRTVLPPMSSRPTIGTSALLAGPYIVEARILEDDITCSANRARSSTGKSAPRRAK